MWGLISSRAQEPDKGQDEQQCITVNECINSFTAGMTDPPNSHAK